MYTNTHYNYFDCHQILDKQGFFVQSKILLNLIIIINNPIN